MITRPRRPELTARALGNTSDTATEVRDNLTYDERHRRRPTILIHGFAVPYNDAIETYEKFRSVYLDSLWPSSLRGLPDFWEFHWPGNRAGLDPLGVNSKRTFSNRIGSAQSAGGLLATYLEDKLLPDQQVTLIAHSLGCQVALQCLGVIRGKGAGWEGPKVTLVILMAAAVPHTMCAPGSDYGEALAGCREVSLHSSHDWVLLFLFRPGRSGFGRGASQAVGRYGKPENRWDSGSEATGLGHGGYWKDEVNAQRLGCLLGTAAPNVLPSNSTPAWQLASTAAGL